MNLNLNGQMIMTETCDGRESLEIRAPRKLTLAKVDDAGTTQEGSPVIRCHVETLMTYKLGFDQTYYTFALILLMKIVPGSRFLRTKLYIMCFSI